MNDLERALRGTLADPPVQVPEYSDAKHDIEARVERRRSRQKRAATGLVAVAVAAAIAVPVATSTGDSSADRAGSKANGAAAQSGPVGGRNRPGPRAALGTPTAVQKAASALARAYGRPRAPAQWVRTNPARWDRLRHEASGTEHTSEVYVLQFPRYRCTIHCRNLPEASTQPTALVATVATTGKQLDVAFTRTYELAALGTVHTFTVR